MLKSYGISMRDQVIIYQSIEEKAKPTPLHPLITTGSYTEPE